MDLQKFLNLYNEDGLTKVVADLAGRADPQNIQLKGLSGSLDAIIAACVHKLHTRKHQIFVMHDKEEAAYFHTDLQNLLPAKEILLFPVSYKRPYQYEAVENANVLLRAEILSRLNNSEHSGEMIITYPEALSEKVINRSSLAENTISARVGDDLNVSSLEEALISYGFEKTDFVYEAGQFAIRGGIIDIFSFANELPYRIELFGNHVESIRSFDPESQLSSGDVKGVNIIPNVQTRLLEEQRQSFLEYLPDASNIWFKDMEQTLDELEIAYQKVNETFDNILEGSGNTQVVLHPKTLFETKKSFEAHLRQFTQIEFGNRFTKDKSQVVAFESSGQPSFDKNFEILAENLLENQSKGIRNVIAAESHKQIERLHTIFEEIDPDIVLEGLNIGLRSGFVDKHTGIACYTDHQLFEKFHRYKTPEKHSKSKALTLKEMKNLNPGDYVVHIDYGIGRFAGLDKIDVGGREQEALRLVYKDDDLLYVSVHSLHKISKYSGKEGIPPSINKLGSQEWDNKKKRVKKKVRELAVDLISLYAKRKAAPGYAFSKDSFLQAELESSFIYEDTPDQSKVTEDVKEDMETPHPMDRLVCGDVGFGKTEVAVRAAFKAIDDGKQVAILVPTTILAMQHYRTFIERLQEFPITVSYISRFKSTKQIKETLKAVQVGEVDILIGTHRLLNKDVRFKNLGLLVIDEEQKFGVAAKERLKEIKINVDTLTLTATPIPRTLHFSLMGARDLSIIATPPPNRQPVTTELHTFSETVIRDAISYELRRGGQVFFVHNRVGNIEEVANMVLKLVPDARIAVAHGQMDGSKLEKTMLRFIDGGYDVLISTNIIESGLDIPNANTIIINQAHMFGLSDLHQMRGRVGRSNRKAFCYLLSPPASTLTSDARKRLTTLEEFSELGDGFRVAMRDLDIRGAGNLLGKEQSGFISDLGFETYHKILDEAVDELKKTEFRALFKEDLAQKLKPLVQDCVIETDLELIIPEDYVTNISERLSLYSQLDNIENKEELTQFAESLRDRFGALPESVTSLIETVRLRWHAEELGFEKLIIKNESMRCYFVSADNSNYYKSETFGKILQFVQTHPKKCQMRETKNKLILTLNEILSIDDAINALAGIL